MTRNPSLRELGAFALLLGALPTPAAAHSTFKGMGTFYSFMLHPFVVPAHLLVLIATGLMLGQQDSRIGGMGLRALAVGLVFGLLLDAGLGNETVPERGLLLVALLLGAAVSLGRSMPFSLVMLGSGVAGLMIGLDSAPGVVNTQTLALAYAGLSFGIMWIVTIIEGYTVDLTRDWQSIGKRIVGSWIVAASLLTLTLSFYAPSKQAVAAAQMTVVHNQ